MSEYKVIAILTNDNDKKRKIRPVRLCVPDDVKIMTELPKHGNHGCETFAEWESDLVHDWVYRIDREGDIGWSWGWSYFTEYDVVDDPIFTNLFKSIEWDKVEPQWFTEPNDHESASDYCSVVRQPVPKYEPLIAQDGETACEYAINCLRDFFPLGEPAIAQDSYYSVKYVEYFSKRLKEAEPMLAKSKGDAEKYAEIMRRKELWADWTVEELSRSPVWLFCYAKDYIKGPLPEQLHAAMMLFSFNDSKNEYVQRYFKTKRYQPKHLRAPPVPRAKKKTAW